MFTVKTNQREVAFQADTLEAAAQWVTELQEHAQVAVASSLGLSALSTPFSDQYQQTMYPKLQTLNPKP